ncbi:PecA family PE domain-processing aspartic protease [Mycolicibacterium vinylchloridicum]|uniref:PecA family PE domain-processing aspartic protease n=1 Tax=Mycolicibacterium vinylchloridicum TaxID=2736928 RepID=UPI0015C95C73|nr:PecA family PE domain-processing aspartic protease [Mycolicibacterium vinylchloridicum]
MKHSDSARRRRRQPYAWLGAGAVTLGIGAALAGGCAVASADTGAGSGSAKASSSSSDSSSASSNSSTTKKTTAHSARSGVATSSGATAGSRKAPAAASSNTPVAAAVDTGAPETTTAATGHSARLHTAATETTTTAETTTAAALPAADPSPNMNGYLPSEPIVAGVAVNLAQQQIADARALLQQQTWGSGNIPAGIVAIIPQVLLAQAALSLDTWETAITPAQSLYARTSGVPFVHELAGVSLLGALLLPTLATTALTSAGLFLPLVGAFEGTGGITPVQNLVSTAALNGRVYALVPVVMRATTEPIVYISINGGQSTPVLVDTGSSGLVVTMASVGDAAPLGSPTGTGSSGYSGGLSYDYTTYTTTVNFGNGIVSGPTSVNIVDSDDEATALAFFHQLGGASGVLGIGANAAGPGPSIPTTALPGELSDGVFLYQGLFLGIAGVMVFGPNPLPVRTSVPGAPDAYLNVKINNGTPTQVGAIIDSGGVYGTILSSQIGGASYVPVGTRISVYTPDGVLLYSYIVTSQNRPTVITSGLINTGYAPFQHGPVYINYTAPDGIGSTDFDYA